MTLQRVYPRRPNPESVHSRIGLVTKLNRGPLRLIYVNDPDWQQGSTSRLVDKIAFNAQKNLPAFHIVNGDCDFGGSKPRL
jgi:hypothetical protein